MKSSRNSGTLSLGARKITSALALGQRRHAGVLVVPVTEVITGKGFSKGFSKGFK